MYIDRIAPLTRHNWRRRGLQVSDISDGSYLLDGGAERLVQEWKRGMNQLMATYFERYWLKTPYCHDLFQKSGSSSFTPKQWAGMTDHEFLLLSRQLAPIESDGRGDRKEWNLFDTYLHRVLTGHWKDLKKPHSLSDVLYAWKADKVSLPLLCTQEIITC